VTKNKNGGMLVVKIFNQKGNQNVTVQTLRVFTSNTTVFSGAKPLGSR